MTHKSWTAVATLLALSSLTSALPRGVHERCETPEKTCADVKGSFVIEQLGLYPENADFDTEQCVLYIGSLFNASVAIYNPSTHNTSILEIPAVTHNPQYHVGGVAINPYTSLLSIVVDAGAAFTTAGTDISGTNLLLLYDPTTSTELYRINLTETTHGAYGGFQDVEFDSKGNVYVVGTFPSSILRIEGGPSKPLKEAGGWNGTVTVNEWYKSDDNHTVSGFGGLAMAKTSAGEEVLLVNDNPQNRIVRFDPQCSKGDMRPVPIPSAPANQLPVSDAIYLPSKYAGTVLLAAVNAVGVAVLQSRDGKWESGEYLGTVSNNVSVAEGGIVPAAVQMGESIFMLEEYFGDALPGNRTRFPFVDITEQVEGLVNGSAKGWPRM